jgi:Protein of unknown function (DUF2892)
MTMNTGSIDRILRVIVGVLLLALVFIGPQSPWGLIGLVPLMTGLVGYCPAYAACGLSTCRARRR